MPGSIIALKPRRKTVTWISGILICFVLQSCGGNRTDEQYIQIAKKAIEQGNRSGAIIELKNALQINPDSAEARQLLGETYIYFRDGSSAEKELRQAQNLGTPRSSVVVPFARSLFLQQKFDEVIKEATVSEQLRLDQKAELLAIRGQSYLYSGNLEQARTELDQSLAINDQTVTALLGHAMVNSVAGDRGSVRPWIESALSIDPQRAEGWGMLGSLEESSGDLDAAEEAYTKAQKASIDPSRYFLQRALLRIQQQRFNDAEEDIDQLSDNHFGKHYAKGLIQFRQEQYKSALNSFQKALALRSNYAPAMYFLGVSHFMLGHEGQTDNYLKQYLEIVPKSNDAANILAQLQLRQGDLEGAEGRIDRVLGRDPDNSQALELKASLLIIQGRRAETIEIYKKLVQLNPESGEALSRLGLTLMAQGDIALGTAELEKAIALEPDMEKLQLGLFLGLLNSGEKEKALASAEQWVNNKPQSSPARLMLGWALLANKQADKAKITFEKVLELSPGNASASHNLAVLAKQKGDVNQAITYYQDSLKIYPDHPGTITSLATLYVLLNQSEKAIPMLDHIWQIKPNLARPAVLLAELLLKNNEAKRAVLVLSETVKTNPDNTSVLTVLGAAQAEVKSYKQAALTFENLVALQPDSARSYYLLAQVYFKSGEKNKFVAAIEKSYQLNPNVLDSQVAMFGLLVEQKKLDEAQDLITRLKSQRPDSADVHAQSARLSTAQGKIEKATQDYQRALELAPERSDLLVKYALSLWQAGQHENALQKMEGWLQAKPNDEVVKYNLASLYLLADKKPEALTTFDEIVKRNPNHIIALNNLASLLTKSEPEKALEYAERAHRLAPNAPAVSDTLAMILLDQQGHEARALMLLENAVKQAPANAEINYHLALAQLKNGQKQQAIELLTRLANSNNDFPAKHLARDLLAELEP